MSKYDRLREHLQTLPGNRWETTVDAVEAAAGCQLPPEARRQRQWWANLSDPKGQCAAWIGAGWHVDKADVALGTVSFRRVQGAPGSTPPLARPAPRPRTLSVASDIPSAAWDASSEVRVGIRFTWRPIGSVSVGDDGLLRFPSIPTAPGVYRFRVRTTQGGERLYIGETEDLRVRFSRYRKPGRKQRTNIRIRDVMLATLADGGEVSVSIAADIRIERGQGSEPADMSSAAVRLAVENLALVESGGVTEVLNL